MIIIILIENGDKKKDETKQNKKKTVFNEFGWKYANGWVLIEKINFFLTLINDFFSLSCILSSININKKWNE